MGWAAAIPIAMQVAGSVAGAAGKEQEASAQATSSRYQAAVAANNAAIARNNALTATRVGEVKGTQQELKNRGQLGSIVAQQAANGIDVNTGSAKKVQDSARILGRLDTMTIRSDASKEAYGYETEAQNYDAESGLLKKQAKDSEAAGDTGAFTSILSGASSAFGMSGSSSGTTPLSTGANVLNTDYMDPQADRAGF